MTTKSKELANVLQMYGDWYSASNTPEDVTFGPVRGLSITGQGEPGGTAHTEALTLLLAVAKELGELAAREAQPFSMPPIEGRWWVEDTRLWSEVPREQWRWHLFVRLPDLLPVEFVDEAREKVRAAKDMLGAARVQYVTFTDGLSVQAMHHGPYAEEPETLAWMNALMTKKGLVPNGLHHEIYLSDLRETNPKKIRVILRQPVRKAG